MTEEISRLRIEVDSLKAALAEKDLDRLAKTGGRAEKATDGLTSAFKRYVSVAAAGATVLAGIHKLIDTQREFDRINAGLVTITGSTADAKVAFSAIQDFATNTPYDLKQVSEAFIQLANRGLDPSERALTSYGNTAAAMGRDLEDMVRAVAQATTGEFEPLKSFGIKAKKNADGVAFTFRGLTTQVKDNAHDIEQYFIKLGETDFAGTMDQRMKTLDGALSNLGDEWDKLFLNISQSGIGDGIADAVRTGIDWLSKLNDFVSSGQFEGYLGAMGAAWGPWVDDAKEAISTVQQSLSDYLASIEQQNPDLVDALERAWKEFPENVRAIVQLVTVHFAHFVEDIKARAEFLNDALHAVFNDDTIAGAYQRATDRLAANDANLRGSIDLILQERDATIASAQAKVDAADKARAAYEKEKAAKAGAHGDRLAKYGLGNTGSVAGGVDDKVQKARERELQQVVEGLKTEEEKIRDSYDRRLKIITENTQKGSAVQQDLIRRLGEARDKEMADLKENQDREINGLRDQMRTEEDTIAESYRKRREIVEKANISPEERQQMLDRLQQDQQKELDLLDMQRAQKRLRLLADSMSDQELYKAQMDEEIAERKRALDEKLISEEEFQKEKRAIELKYEKAARDALIDQQVYAMSKYGEMAGALGQLMGQLAHGHGKNAERMFKISKALNMAQAIMGMAAGIMEAQKEPNMYMRIAESIRIAALGAVQIASISSAKFSGAYDKGGFIPSGSVGVMSEYGDELLNGQLVKGPARVTSRRDTERMMGGGGGGVTVNISVNVNNDGGATAETSVKGGKPTDAQNAKELAQMIDLRTRDVLIREQRPGGLLYKATAA